jgi:hypothetical protein
MTTEIKYFCQNCKHELNSDDKVCPGCGGIQKDIEVFIEAETGLYGKLSTHLTEVEQKTLVRVSKFFQEELRKWSSGSVSVSLKFPSGVGITLHWKKDKETE